MIDNLISVVNHYTIMGLFSLVFGGPANYMRNFCIIDVWVFFENVEINWPNGDYGSHYSAMLLSYYEVNRLFIWRSAGYQNMTATYYYSARLYSGNCVKWYATVCEPINWKLGKISHMYLRYVQHVCQYVIQYLQLTPSVNCSVLNPW